LVEAICSPAVPSDTPAGQAGQQTRNSKVGKRVSYPDICILATGNQLHTCVVFTSIPALSTLMMTIASAAQQDNRRQGRDASQTTVDEGPNIRPSLLYSNKPKKSRKNNQSAAGQVCQLSRHWLEPCPPCSYVALTWIRWHMCMLMSHFALSVNSQSATNKGRNDFSIDALLSGTQWP
jgi:hypothetical protein